MKMEYNGFTGSFDSKGAYLEYLEKDGIDLIRKSPDGNSTHGGAAVLFPFGNRVRDAEYTYDNRNYQLPRNDGKNSIHGLVRDLIFDSIEGDNYIEFSRHLQSDSYPGEAEIKIRYEFSENSFETTFCVKSLTGKIPVEIGFHPYFIIDGAYSIAYSGTMKKLNYSDKYFPDGTTTTVNYNGKEINNMKLDNCFYLNSPISIRDKTHSVTIIRKNMPYIVIYNGEHAGNNAVAIEPMTGAPDAYHNGIGILSLDKGNDFKCAYSIEVS